MQGDYRAGPVRLAGGDSVEQPAEKLFARDLQVSRNLIENRSQKTDPKRGVLQDNPVK